MGREEKQLHTREQLFEAATELMVSKGYHAASVSDIAEQAGYSKGAFFSNFASKADLLVALTQRFKGVEIERLGQALASGASTAELSQGLLMYIDNLKNNKPCVILDVELQLIAARDADFAQHYHDLHQANSEALGTLIELIFHHRGKQAPMSRELLAMTFTALSEGLMLQGRDDPAEQIRLVLEALIEKAPGLPSTA
ncbi:TetR/AcrR family transcriptional regulator [Metapseudomonas otitidis]|jgi:AcrR family transcriptional regulator|uniref:TetR/AcrR family transcriptional regulator n=1 Tax=Metapseudomonas otitidis TaxID=319939 RepID=UPI00366DEB5E